MQDASDLENFATEESLKKSRSKRHRILPISPDTSEDEEVAVPKPTEDAANNNKKKATCGNGEKTMNLPIKPVDFVTITEARRIDNVEAQVTNHLPSKSVNSQVGKDV